MCCSGLSRNSVYSTRQVCAETSPPALLLLDARSSTTLTGLLTGVCRDFYHLPFSSLDARSLHYSALGYSQVCAETSPPALLLLGRALLHYSHWATHRCVPRLLHLPFSSWTRAPPLLSLGYSQVCAETSTTCPSPHWMRARSTTLHWATHRCVPRLLHLPFSSLDARSSTTLTGLLTGVCRDFSTCPSPPGRALLHYSHWATHRCVPTTSTTCPSPHWTRARSTTLHWATHRCVPRLLHLPFSSLDARSSTTLTGLLTGVCTLTIASLALCTCLSPWTRAPPLLCLHWATHRCVHADDCLSRTLHLPLSLDARSSTTLTGLLTGVCTLTIASLALCTCLSPWTRAPPLLSLGYSQVCVLLWTVWEHPRTRSPSKASNQSTHCTKAWSKNYSESGESAEFTPHNIDAPGYFHLKRTRVSKSLCVSPTILTADPRWPPYQLIGMRKKMSSLLNY